MRSRQIAGLVLLTPIPLGGMALPDASATALRGLGGNHQDQRQLRIQSSSHLTAADLDHAGEVGARVPPATVAALFDAWSTGHDAGRVPSVVDVPVLIINAVDDPLVTRGRNRNPDLPGARRRGQNAGLWFPYRRADSRGSRPTLRSDRPSHPLPIVTDDLPTINVILLPLVGGQQPQWTAEEMRALFPSLICWLLSCFFLGILSQAARELAQYFLGSESPVRAISRPEKATQVLILGGVFAGVTTAERLERQFRGDPTVSFTLPIFGLRFSGPLPITIAFTMIS
jgi:hypothetical protein